MKQLLFSILGLFFLFQAIEEFFDKSFIVAIIFLVIGLVLIFLNRKYIMSLFLDYDKTSTTKISKRKNKTKKDKR